MLRAEDNLARRGFLAAACPDGPSDQYPKGTSAIRDHEHRMFADGRPLQTMAHVRQNLVVAAHSTERFPDETMELRAKEGQLEDLLRAGQQALKSQPFSALIGAKLTSFSEGKAVLEVPIREELLQQTGTFTAA